MKKFLCALLVVSFLVSWGYTADAAKKGKKKAAPQKAPKEAVKVLSSEEIEEIYQSEQTPYKELFQKVSVQQQKLIVEECKAATEKDIKAADKAADAKFVYAKNPAAWSDYQYELYRNLNFQSRQKIAKDYGIKVGDTFILERAEAVPDLREDALREKE